MKHEPTETKAVAVEVVQWNHKQRELLPIASAALEAGKELEDKLRAVVRFIIQAEMTPAEVAPVLKEAGYKPNRISEFKGIVATSVASGFAAKKITWRGAVSKSVEERAAKKGKNRKGNPVAPLFSLFDRRASKLSAPKARRKDGLILLLISVNNPSTTLQCGDVQVTVLLNPIETHGTIQTSPEDQPV